MEFERIADKKRLDFIVSAVMRNTPADSTVLDIGCGNGIVSRALGAHGFYVTGIDVSPKTIDAAKSFNNLPNVNFKVSGSGELKAEPDKYAAIICSEVLEHLHQPADMLRIIHRSLKNDGVLIVTVPNGTGPRELFVTRPVQYLQGKNGTTRKLVNKIKHLMGYKGMTVQSSADDLRHIQFFTKRSLAELAGSTHFSIEQIRAANFIEQVFPFSFVAKRSSTVQKIDCWLADTLPLQFTSGFMSVWKKQ